MKYERIILKTYHGFDGKVMNLGKPCGATTEYDQEAQICAFLQMLIIEAGKRCEYIPKTPRQKMEICSWRKDLSLTIRCSLAAKQSHFSGTYEPTVGEAFQSWPWRGSGDICIVLNKSTSLQSPQITSRDIFRHLILALA
jgi:hypothetical protein